MHEAGALADQVLVARGAQLVAARGRAPVLPDERAVDGLAGRPVPDDDRLALVGDADRAQLARPRRRRRRAPRRRRAGDVPDLGRVVLDPAGPREVLRELAVRRGRDRARRGRRRGRWCPVVPWSIARITRAAYPLRFSLKTPVKSGDTSVVQHDRWNIVAAIGIGGAVE